MSVTTQHGMIEADELEVWEMAVAGTVYLQKTVHTRHGVAMSEDLKIGPNRVGHKVKILASDREMNQEKMTDAINDPFRNGMLVRVDRPQNEVEATSSPDAVSTDDLLMIFDKKADSFEKAVKGLGEIPVRRLRSMAEAIDATHSQVAFLDEYIETTYGLGRAAQDAVFDLNGERRPEREGKEPSND
jgi:hypothetical protein